MEILDGQADCSYFEFHRTLNTLSLRVAGASALSYVEMMKRRERLAFYAQVRAEARKGLALLTVLRSLSFPSSQSDWTHAGVGGVQGCSLLRTASTRSGRAGPGLKPRHLDSDTRSLVGGCAVHVDGINAFADVDHALQANIFVENAYRDCADPLVLARRNGRREAFCFALRGDDSPLLVLDAASGDLEIRSGYVMPANSPALQKDKSENADDGRSERIERSKAPDNKHAFHKKQAEKPWPQLRVNLHNLTKLARRYSSLPIFHVISISEWFPL